MAENKCKYYKLVRQVSYNSGQTWSNVDPPQYQQGDLYEPYSDDCPSGDTPTPIYRWVSGTTCVRFDKYSVMIEEVSYDNGETWWSTGSETGKTLIERDSLDCTKLYVTYGDGSSEKLSCDDGNSDVGTTKITKYDTRQILCCFSDIASVIVGNCATEISMEAFSGCTSLTSVTIGSGVTTIGWSAFEGCSGLTNIHIPSNVEVIGISAFQDCSGLTSCTIDNGKIAQNAFLYCYNLTNVTLGSGVTSIGENAFYYCHNLSHINIPNTVTNIGAYAFYHCCESLKSIEIPDSVTIIDSGAFDMCCVISSITIGSGIETIGDDAFSSCPELTSLTINATTPPTLLRDGEILYNSSSCMIYVPSESVNAYKAAWTRYANRIYPIGYVPPAPTGNTKWVSIDGFGVTATSECNSSQIIAQELSEYIVSLEIGECVTSIGYGAFEDYGLTNVVFSNNIEDIGGRAFAYCNYLRSISLPNSVTSIDSDAFYNCTRLTSVTIGSGIETIGDDAFYGCTSLTSITINALTPPTLGSSSVFLQTNDCPIYVPAASVEVYKTANRWSSYASRIQAIP